MGRADAFPEYEHGDYLVGPADAFPVCEDGDYLVGPANAFPVYQYITSERNF